MEYLCQDFVSNYRQNTKPTNFRQKSLHLNEQKNNHESSEESSDDDW